MQWVCVYFCYAGAQERAEEVFVAFELGLEDYEGEGGFWVGVGGCIFDVGDLSRQSTM